MGNPHCVIFVDRFDGIDLTKHDAEIERHRIFPERINEFKDTECGIPEEYKDRIFEPFFTTKMDWKGTGLGLSICYDIIKNHKGSIVVDSQLGKGAVFTIILPVKNNKNV